MEEDNIFSKLTPESIAVNYIFGMNQGDFGILDDVKLALHQQIALEFIKHG